MTDTPNRSPLWREMETAGAKLVLTNLVVEAGPIYAAEILAMRDYLFPGGRPDPVGVSLDCLTIWDELTAEAKRAEWDND